MAVKEEAARKATPVWKLADAKARFGELVRRARSEGPQRVALRGSKGVVVIASEDLDRLAPRSRAQPLLEFLKGLHVEGFELEREYDTGREFLP